MTDRDDDRMTPSEAVALTVTMALTAFNGTSRAHRGLLEETRASVSRDRPAHITRLAESIPNRERQVIESRAAEVARITRLAITELFATPTSTDNEQSPLHPIAPEQLAVYVMAARGKAQVGTDLAPLLEVCEDDASWLRYALAYLQWTLEEPPAERLGRALLPVVVADFEELLGALVRLWLTIDASAFGVEQETAASEEPTEVRAVESRNRERVDKRVQRFLNDGAAVWGQTLTERIEVPLFSPSDAWHKAVEALARRNAIVHAGGRVDSTYLRQAHLEGDQQPKLGTALSFDAPYVLAAIEAFERVAQLLAVGILFRLTAGSESFVEFTEDQVFQALAAAHWLDAREMARLALETCPPGHEAHELQVNFWMARRELDDDWESLRREVEAWEPPENAPRYLLAKAALLEDEPAVLGALESYVEQGFRVRDIAHWPLVVKMTRKSSRVKRAVALAVSRSGRPPRRPTRAIRQSR